jgi:hypothetical protein
MGSHMGTAGKILLFLVVVSFALISVLWLHLRLAASPKRPKDLPTTAVWIPAPPAPLDFSPRGYWLACWLDHTRNVDRCKLTDYQGNPSFDEDYSPVVGTNPVPEDLLNLKNMGSSDLWAVVGQDLVPIARLKDGTILVPTRNLAQLRPRYVH